MLSSELCDDECWNKTVNHYVLQFISWHKEASIKSLRKEKCFLQAMVHLL